MLQTSVYVKKTIVHHPKPDDTVLLERVTETMDLNSGHLHSQVEPLPPDYVSTDEEEKRALAALAPMPSGHRVVLVGRGKRETQEEYDKRTGMGTRPAIDVQSANAAQADALKQAMRPTSPTMLEAAGLVKRPA